MDQTGLILEGGGMRGVYTAGVLDYMMDQRIKIPSIYAVSAGACHGTSYASGQRGRPVRTVLEYVNDPRYASFRNLVFSGNLFGRRFVYQDIPDRLIPFDYDAYRRSGVTFRCVVTNCETGEAEYPIARELKEDMPLVLASSSLPLFSRMVQWQGGRYLDGGIADSIPLARAIADGCTKNVVVLTQHRGYVKKPTQMMRLMRVRYRRYPRMLQALARRHERYQEALDLVYRQEASGNAIVIQPSTPVTIRQFEKDTDRLRALYEQGYADAEACGEALRGFVANAGLALDA